MSEHWIIIGASSAIARAFATEAAAAGANFTLAGRDGDDLERSAADLAIRYGVKADAAPCDVADARSRAAFLERDWDERARLNVFMAAGAMPEHSDMEKDAALLEAMMASTYAGPVLLLNGFAAMLEQRRGGRIVVIGSVAGDRGRKKNFLYGSAKAGLAVFADGLRARLCPVGVSVTLVKPGFVDTAMTWGLPGVIFASAPESAARAIYKAAEKGRAEIYHPFFWRWIMLIIKLLPSSIMKRLNF